MQATINIVCIPGKNAPYIEMQSNHSKHRTFITSRIMDVIKVDRKFFLNEINKNMLRQPGIKCYVHTWGCHHLRRI